MQKIYMMTVVKGSSAIGTGIHTSAIVSLTQEELTDKFMEEFALFQRSVKTVREYKLIVPGFGMMPCLRYDDSVVVWHIDTYEVEIGESQSIITRQS